MFLAWKFFVGVPVADELGCPSFVLSHNIFFSETEDVVKAVSMVHQCDSSCQFVTKSYSRNVERETILASRLEYVHDYCNNLKYSLNVYCLSH